MTLLDDVRLALRGLRRQPGFLVVAVLTLGIAIGANIAVFSLVNATMLRPLPFGDRSDRVVSVHASHSSEAEDWEDAHLSYADLEDLRAAAVIEDAGGFVERNFTLQDGEAERVVGGSVTPNLFPLLGAEPSLGRQFREDDAAAPGLESVVIITHGLWQRRLGGRSDVIGQTMHINGRGLTVVGIMAPGFAFPEDAQLYLPLRWDDAPRAQRSVATFGLLRAGQSVDQAQQAVDALASRLSGMYPATHDGWSMRVLTFRDLMIDPGDRQLRVMLTIAVGFVLLIGCANLAALLLARGEARRREFAVRVALGARRLDLLRTSLVESGLIAALGTGAALLVAAWALELLPRAFADGLPYWVDLRPDARVASFTVGLAALTAAALGAGPGVRFSRPDVNETLKSSSAGNTASPGVQRSRGLLVIAQVALSVALIMAAVITVRSVIALQFAKSGIADSELVTFRTYLSGDQYDAPEARAAAFKAIVDELQATPGVRSTAATTSIPTDDGGAPIQLAPGGTWIRGRELGAHRIAVSPTLFTALGLNVEGRTFTDEEFRNAQADVVIVSRALAQRLWPRESALDRRLGVVTAGRLEGFRVVGVVPDIVYEEIGEETEQSRLIVYMPYSRVASRTMAVMVRTAGRPDASIATIRSVMRQRFGGLPAYDLRTMAQVRTYTTWEQRIFGEVMAGFAVVAVALAWLGVYGLVAYTVARRTREIGLRMALGAHRYDVVKMVMSDIGVMAVAGVGLGVLLGGFLARLLEHNVYGVDVRDPRLLFTAAVTMATAVFAAAFWPARRATRIEPTVALRCD